MQIWRQGIPRAACCSFRNDSSRHSDPSRMRVAPKRLRRVSSAPFLHCVTHRLAANCLHPSHERTVEFKVIPALGAKEAPNLLLATVGGCYRCRSRNLSAVPIKLHHSNLRADPLGDDSCVLAKIGNEDGTCQRPGGHSGYRGVFCESCSQGAACDVQMCITGLVPGSSSNVGASRMTCPCVGRSAIRCVPHAEQNHRNFSGEDANARSWSLPFVQRKCARMTPAVVV